MAIFPADAPHQKAAHKSSISFLKKTCSRYLELCFYSVPNTPAVFFFYEEVATNKGVYPTQEVKRKNVVQYCSCCRALIVMTVRCCWN